MICLRCGFVSPAGSIYCSGCGRGLGGRVCSSGHRSPSGAGFCATCGKSGTDLSDPAPCLDVTRIARAAAWSLIAAAFVWDCHHPLQALSFFAGLCLWGLGHLLGLEPNAIVRITYEIAFYFLLTYLLSYVLPERVGGAIRRFLDAGLIRWPGIAWRVVRVLWRLTVRVVEGPSSQRKEGGNAKQRGN